MCLSAPCVMNSHNNYDRLEIAPSPKGKSSGNPWKYEMSWFCDTTMFKLVILLVFLTAVASASFNATELLKDPRGMSAGYLDHELAGSPDVKVSNLKATGDHGVDVSQQMDASTASCLVGQGWGNMLIPRGFTSTGHVDSAACPTLTSGKTGGFNTNGAYLFPCPSCGPAADQVNALAAAMYSCSAFTGRIWLDIEGSQYWLGDTDRNRAWFQDLVDSCKSQTMGCGIYSSQSQWSAIFGSSSYSYGNDLPLWYAHYDGVASFSDWSTHSFAGFSPSIKQFMGTTSLCGFGVDQNYAPTGAR